jgi:hypothetical protein
MLYAQMAVALVGLCGCYPGQQAPLARGEYRALHQPLALGVSFPYVWNFRLPQGPKTLFECSEDTLQ